MNIGINAFAASRLEMPRRRSSLTMLAANELQRDIPQLRRQPAGYWALRTYA
jgi:hypothetical protein